MEELDDLLNILPHGRPACGLEVILLLREEIDKLSSSGDEIVQFPSFFGRFLTEDEVVRLPGEADEQFGINDIGLGEPTHSLGKITDARGEDDGDLELLLEEKVDEFGVVDAGGFEDDLAVVMMRQLFDESFEPVLVVVKPGDSVGVGGSDIEVGLGDIDTDMMKSVGQVVPVS